MNANLLKGKIKEAGFTQEWIAAQAKISLSRFNAKLNGWEGAEFTASEIRSIRDLLGLTSEDIDRIFFADEVS